MASDFPEIDGELLEVRNQPCYCMAKFILDWKARDNASATIFALKENPHVIYAYPAGIPWGYTLPWTRDYWKEPDLTASQPKDEEENGYDAMEITLDGLLVDERFQFKPGREAVGYIDIYLRMSENGNGRVFMPEDCPGIGCNLVVEFRSGGLERRRLVIGIEEQTVEATTAALYALAENPLVWFWYYYTVDGPVWD